MDKKMYIFALAAYGQGISGGDRIFIELARRWSKDCKITIHVWEEGLKMCQSQNLNMSGIRYQVLSMHPWKYFGFFVNYLARVIEGIRIGLTLNLENNQRVIVYSASEFWMDSLPAIILKLRFSKIKWVAAWFQTAPNPLNGFAEGRRDKRYRLRSLAYFLVQLPIKPLISKFADFVLVNNEEEQNRFPLLKRQGKTIIVFGAVDIEEISNWRVRFKKLPKIYDGIFQGRFHPQKGVLELIDIWKLVVDQKSNARLVMIGDGPLMKDVKNKINSLRLENNVILKSYLFDGEEKYKIFSQSKVVLHPAFYDSGGMAAAEAMAFGVPAVGFDLSSFKSYYPEGMIKVKIGDLHLFAKNILELLNNQGKRDEIGNKALNMINMSWSWEKRAKDILKVI